ncbi:MAG: ABC transporter permease [Bacteroidota bacterium]
MEKRVLPKHLLRFFRWFCHPDYVEDIEGDLHEKYARNRRTCSKRKADWLLLLTVFSLFRPSLMRPVFKNKSIIHPAMFKHNLLITLRSFRKYKSSFFINLVGLSIGLASALMIYLWVNEELKMDHFFANKDRLFVVKSNYHMVDGVSTDNSTPSQLARALKAEIPEIEYAANVIEDSWFDVKKGIITVADQKSKAVGILAERDYFDLFSWHILVGDRATLLEDKQAVVISYELAKKLFDNTENAIGQTLDWAHEDFSGLFKVTGVFEKNHRYATEQFDAVFNYQFFFDGSNDSFKDWRNSGPDTYVMVKEGTDVGALNEKMKDFRRNKLREYKDEKWIESIGDLFLQPYTDQYLYNHFENGQQSGGRITYVRLFTVVGIFILLLASINFMNLSTAKATQRMSEIGIKKAVGASQKSIVTQFLGESILLTFLALGIAVGLVIWLLPEFNTITNKQIDLALSKDLVLAVLGITLMTGLLSGSYPALYLSRFRPLHLLKGKLNRTSHSILARKGLVVFQFSISVFLIISVTVVYQQMQYIQAKNLGFETDNIISFGNEGALTDDPQTFLQEIEKLPGVIATSTFWHNVVGDYGTTGGVKWAGMSPEEKIDFGTLNVDYNWLELMGLEMVEGRTYSEQYSTENQKIIFNESAIKAMGLVNPIGQTINLWGQDRTIIGVVKDFHFASFYEKIRPCFIQFTPNNSSSIVRIKAGAEEATLQQIKQAHQAFNAGLSFDYRFLDEEYAALYAAEQRVATLSQYFSAIAILISCLGLFGLASFTAAQRQKEISIRKVLGASVANLWQLLSKDFVVLIVVACGIAMPLGYVLLDNWLAQFAYRTEWTWWIFGLTGLSILLIALVTVSFQAIKVALVNPSKVLKGE